MLTMLHAKTLSRKRFGTLEELKVTKGPETHEFDASKPKKGSLSFIWSNLTIKLRRLFGCAEENVSKKEPASTGKIYNLMR